jgi:3-phosphoshikimate 1-carboxyvinyltransferase
VKLRVRPVRRLTGQVEVPGDKSVSHRAALLGALAEGVTEIHGYLEAEDCLGTLAAVEALGVEVSRKGPGEYRIAGAGSRRLSEPADVINCGNSGTMARLLIGVLAGQPFWTLLTGDASMRSRPMARVTEPLARMGARFVGRAEGTRLPLAVRGAEPLHAIDYTLPMASAQVKSAILLAGLSADGPVSVTEPAASRDHSERMLRQFGARIEQHGTTTTIAPGMLSGTAVLVPGDISSAAFMLVAGLVVAEGRVAVQGVGLNPTRTGVLEALAAMGAGLHVEPDRAGAGEPCGRVTATTSVLRGTTVGGTLIPRLVDEVPALAVAAALAQGRTEIRDAAELRVKESDRLAALAHELGALGAQIVERPDGLVIQGGVPLRGVRVHSRGDHRIAMALAVAGLVAEGETIVEDSACIATSFPQFVDTLNALAGAPVVTVEP